MPASRTHAPAPAAAATHPTLEAGLALGLDAGGGGTRWCLMRPDGEVVKEGQGPALPALAPLSATSPVPDAGRRSGPDSALEAEAARAQTLAALHAVLAQVALALPQLPHTVVAGITGFEPVAMPALRPHLAAAFGVAHHQLAAVSDIELLCRMAFAPGEGILVYAGTGSIAAHLRADGSLQRAGGRGAVIDDAGGGHWIAAQALRQVWRMEDERPGSAQQSPLAQALFSRIGGSDWASTRRWVALATRGQMGPLALQVAAAAQSDDAALQLLTAAGHELARLALALLHREGEQPIALAGRVFALHPEVQRALTVELPRELQAQVHLVTEAPHHGAARLACERCVPQPDQANV